MEDTVQTSPIKLMQQFDCSNQPTVNSCEIILQPVEKRNSPKEMMRKLDYLLMNWFELGMLRPENNYYFLSSISSMRFLFFFIFLFLVSSCNYQTKENSSEHDKMGHNSQKNSFGTGNFSIETDFIDERNESSIVNLSNNDTYDLTIGAIGTKIG